MADETTPPPMAPTLPGHDAPTLSSPKSPFTPPTLPGPTAASTTPAPPPPLPLPPAPTDAPAAPGSPTLAAPTLAAPIGSTSAPEPAPVIGTGPSLPGLPVAASPTIAAAPAAVIDGPASPVTSPLPASQSPERRKWPKRFVGVACLAALGVAGGSFGKGFYDQYQENQADATAATAGDVPPDQPVGGVIGDAQNVVDDINDNTTEAELLGEMGLDSSGDSLPTADGGDAGVVDALTFTYTVTRSTSADDSTTSKYLINVESGDFSRVRDGVEVRRIDGVLSERLPERAGWKPADDASAPLEPLGSDGVPMMSEAVPIEMSPHMLSVQDDGIVGSTMVLDAAGYQASEPDSWQTWADRWSVADEPLPADGILRIFVKQRPDGAIHRMDISSELDGWTVGYELTSWLSGAVPVVLN